MKAKICELVRRVMWRIGFRGAFLGFLAILDYLYGLSLIIAPKSQHITNLILPWNAWIAVWFTMGVILSFGIFAKRDRVHFGLATGVKVLWTLALANLAIFHRMSAIWPSVVIFGCFAGLVFIVSWWPEVHVIEPTIIGKDKLDE